MTLQLPEPGEARALADDLRDMMASAQLDQSVLRRAANALDAFASGARLTLANGTTVDFVEGDAGPDPFNGQLLPSFENGGAPSDAEAINQCQ